MSAKNLDKHNRWRNKTVAFRVSPEELSRECIIPSTFDMGVADVVAEAVKAHAEH